MSTFGDMSYVKKLRKVLQTPDHIFSDQKYLEGIRGVLVIEAFLWCFLQTFAPATVKDINTTSSPGYQKILRSTFSVILWNENLIYSALILLSARVVCLPFLKESSKLTVASASFRRGIRLWFPIAVSLAITKAVFSTIGTDYIQQFKQVTAFNSLDIPYTLRGTLAYFNAVFNLFWTTSNFATQAGSKAFPSGTLWVVNVIYMQSYTVYMTMLITPYTRGAWRVKAYIGFVLTACWVQSWAWYSITGLLFADLVVNMEFKSKLQCGIPIWRTNCHLPVWPISVLLMAAGLAMKYLWTAWRPDTGNIELIGHAGLYYTGGLNTDYSLIQPQARDDNYVFLLGFFLFVESSDIAQNFLSNPLFTYLGSRSLSYFLLQSIIIYTAGIKLFLALYNNHRALSNASMTIICAIVCLIILIPGAEIFHRLIDNPSKLLAHAMFDWMCR